MKRELIAMNQPEEDEMPWREAGMLVLPAVEAALCLFGA